MAKLNGVKTIDMINGEITKVAYEGAEYVKVGGLVESTEDILLAIENGTDRTKGEFYRVIGVGSLIRWEDNVSTNEVGAEYIGDRFEVFRKISADKPTLEQRVGALENDVAALKSSDSSLKGEKKSTSTFKVGDTIKVVTNTASHGSKDKAGFHEPGQGIVYVGAIGKVILVKGNYVKAKFAPKDVDKNYETLEKKLRFDEIELVEHVEETIEFEGATYRKVDREAREGDVVVLTGDDLPRWFTKGKAYKIIVGPYNGKCDEGYEDYKVYDAKYGRTRETVDVYEPIEQAKKEASEPKLKAGDYVKFKRSISDTKANKPYLIEYYAERGELAFRDDAGDWCSIAHTGEYEILSAEEAKWAKIGRKPNEFKKGDVVRVLGTCNGHEIAGQLGEVVEPDGTDRPLVRAVYSDELVSLYSRIELVAPVESLFNA